LLFVGEEAQLSSLTGNKHHQRQRQGGIGPARHKQILDATRGAGGDTAASAATGRLQPAISSANIGVQVGPRSTSTNNIVHEQPKYSPVLLEVGVTVA